VGLVNTKSALRLLLSGVSLFPLILVCGYASAEAAPRPSNARIAPTTQCTSAQVRESVAATIEATSSPVVSVLLQTSLQNISKKSCTIAVGPTSPSLVVTDQEGNVAWNNCFTANGEGACAQFLVLKTLKPNTSFTWSMSWHPTLSSTTPPPPWTYTFHSSFGSVNKSGTSPFVLES
jgi:hypothetical protein